jgi:ABC-type sugar transport system ATPase subunit
MIELENVTVRSGGFVLKNLAAMIPAGEYAVLMGGTGQGKTTILEAICGLRPIVSGRIRLGGVDVTQWKPADRSIGYVPQDLALFPTMTVRQHLEFALRLRRVPRTLQNERVDELADVLGIAPLLDRRMRGLSGGEAQRVALGRALSFRPRVLVLDEPLNALDELTRDRLCELLQTIQKKDGLTTLHVTHSRTEASMLANRLLVLAEGRVEQQSVADLRTRSDVPEAAAFGGSPY